MAHSKHLDIEQKDLFTKEEINHYENKIENDKQNVFRFISVLT
jgi:hypothetical protein